MVAWEGTFNLAEDIAKVSLWAWICWWWWGVIAKKETVNCPFRLAAELLLGGASGGVALLFYLAVRGWEGTWWLRRSRGSCSGVALFFSKSDRWWSEREFVFRALTLAKAEDTSLVRTASKK